MARLIYLTEVELFRFKKFEYFLELEQFERSFKLNKKAKPIQKTGSSNHEKNEKKKQEENYLTHFETMMSNC